MLGGLRIRTHRQEARHGAETLRERSTLTPAAVAYGDAWDPGGRNLKRWSRSAPSKPPAGTPTKGAQAVQLRVFE